MAIWKGTDNLYAVECLVKVAKALCSKKCDVYIFGVVLVKLLNEQKSIRLVGAEENRSLAAYFLQVMNENRLFKVFDAQVLREAEKEEAITVAMVKKKDA
ncbi:hypothetical protein CUMW_242920 [Citrus unshiu]|uniref:Serine-threonine/tyrosine-protein kinase catalytic domain-containing protein n=1 Tax=Citrus unshiu TaxID=55188 RepID=A0A2H5QM30_CITUN|nr:hypothetical protein CUMW_242920 [Citrus unshiu]